MPPTNDVRTDQWPTVGWSNWWGLSNGPRPGGMCHQYWLKTINATGVAQPLNDGLFVVYNNVGSVTRMAFVGPSMPFSLTPLTLRFDVDFDDNDNWVLDMSIGTWLDDFAIPLEWADTDIQGVHDARTQFDFPAMGEFSAALISGNLPNRIDITPVNDNGLKNWT